MAFYNNKDFLQHSVNDAFNHVHQPGWNAPLSGIYRCLGCGRSVTSIIGRRLPPQNHHEHGVLQGPIRWQLTVFSHFEE